MEGTLMPSQVLCTPILLLQSPPPRWAEGTGDETNLIRRETAIKDLHSF